MRNPSRWCIASLIATIAVVIPDVAEADRCIVPAGARIFVSSYGSLAFKVTTGAMPTERATGLLFRFNKSGDDELIWESRLVNVPAESYVANDGRAVVTVDTLCRFGFKHSIVVYGNRGRVLADYDLEDLLIQKKSENTSHTRSHGDCGGMAPSLGWTTRSIIWVQIPISR
jgi:hypothetical protein